MSGLKSKIVISGSAIPAARIERRIMLITIYWCLARSPLWNQLI
jgi:hypothetical protein